jgi:hypothetical protein
MSAHLERWGDEFSFHWVQGNHVYRRDRCATGWAVEHVNSIDCFVSDKKKEKTIKSSHYDAKTVDKHRTSRQKKEGFSTPHIGSKTRSPQPKRILSVSWDVLVGDLLGSHLEVS